MAFGLNKVQIIGRLGADVTINHLQNGGRVANLSVATDESYIDRNGSGERIDRTEWHRVVTFQDGLIDMLARHATKGRLVYIDGKLQTRRWSKPGEDSDRFSTEILLVPGGRVQFLDKANGNAAQPGPDEAGGGDPMDGDHIPFQSFPFFPPHRVGASRAGPFLMRAGSSLAAAHTGVGARLESG